MNKKMKLLAFAIACITAAQFVVTYVGAAVPFLIIEEEAPKEEIPSDDYRHFDPELYDDLPQKEEEADESVRYDADVEDSSVAGFKPNYYSYLNSYTYDSFDEIADLYVDTHLYEFSKDELMDAFLRKLLKDNPYLFKLFLNTMLSTMDKYSGYYENDSGFLSTSRGVYGILTYYPNEFERNEKGLVKGVYIKEITPGSSAEAAGLAAGDRITSIGDFNVEGLPFEIVQSLLLSYPFTVKSDEEPVTIETIRKIVNGTVTDKEIVTKVIEYFKQILSDIEAKEAEEATKPENTSEDSAPITEEVKKDPPLTLGVNRNGDNISFSMERSLVAVSPLTMSYDYEKKIANIAIESFTGENMVQELYTMLSEIKQKNITNIIIDLRNNGGGYVEPSLEMANLFVKRKGEVFCYINSRKHEKPEAVKSLGTGDDYKSLVVLINENTASAAELFAMILRDHANATLIGKTTFGKAVGQSVYGLMNGDSFTITDSEILDPGMHSYNEKGISPDIDIDIIELRYKFPDELRGLSLTYDDYLTIKDGEYSDAAFAFEKFFSFLGYMDDDFADGIVDENTRKAILSYLIIRQRTADGVLTAEDIDGFVKAVDKYKAYFSYEDTQMQVARLFFSSLSQAKRLSKELITAGKKAAAEKLEMYEQFNQMIAEQEAADKEATEGDSTAA